MVSSEMNSTHIYHERQSRELCALHALNNLFQAKGTYTKPQLDEICTQLSPDDWINPHRSVLGLGNYDVNVIMTALQKKDCEAVWFDKRKDPSCIDTSQIVGFILNVPTDYRIGFITLPLKRRHWISVREIGGRYYNLDSKLDTPQCIGTERDLFNHLRAELQSNDKELFVVVTSEVEKSQSWLKTKSNLSSTDLNSL
ncbi:unnamed protein product [Hermetia illucens]|uniref:Josephin-2 n=1 Tax=Hermetia illucens TaxID=343691 RepID=A0A7R8YQ75_HERIL|nr:josephin-like protein [Hermetia illucens]CAD7078119.1 unnamed protein product [Hermetia illucens]